MGTFRFTGLEVDLTQFALEGITQLPIVTSTATQLVIGGASSEATLTAAGAGFVYTRVGGRIVDVTAGTLNSFSAQGNGEFSGGGFAWTNLNLSMATLANHLFAENWAAFRAYMFSKADAIYGLAGADVLLSYAGNDTMYGGMGADTLIGGTGDDRLFGGIGADYLRGEAGADTLNGGIGADELRGGGGRDTFLFDTALGQRDTITDFSAADDVIRLDNAVFSAFTANGTMLEARFRAGVAARDTNDRIIYDRAEGVLSYDRDGVGGAAAVIFALVDPGTALGYQDIVII